MTSGENSAREAMDLGGTWEFWPAPDDAESPPSDAVWREMAVPSNWHLAGLPDYSGVVFFRRAFSSLPRFRAAREGDWQASIPLQVLLRLHGVDYVADVWLNGEMLGSHEGYFAPFELDVTRSIRPTNQLLVRVSAPKEAPGDWPNRKRLIKGIFQHHDCRPGAWDPEHGQDEGTGGIWNRVELEYVPPSYISRLQVDARPTTIAGGAALLNVLVETDSPGERGARLRLVAHLVGSPSEATVLYDGSVHLPSGRAEHRLHLELPSPRLWWPWDQGAPDLYMLRAELAAYGNPIDVREVEFGVRELRIAEDTTWWLNGRRIFPRGTNIIPTQWLSTYDEAAIERDVALLRAANVNAVRVHAHVNRDEFYRACDRAGIMVWQDFALQWSYQETDALRAAATKQIGEMARHLANHPSIVVWCCHNEPSFNRDTLDPLLAQALRAVDDSRHIEEASDFRTHPYPGWYWSGIDEFRARPGGPFVSEFGAHALPGREALEAMLGPDDLWPPCWLAWEYHDFQYDQTVNVAGLTPGDDLDDFIQRSQRYQARLLRVAIESYRRAKYRPISGLFQFMFVECWDAISWAVLDYQRRPKLGYFALQRAFQPLLPSIDLRREHAEPGGQLQAGFWIVNDLPHRLEALSLRCGLRDAAGRAWWSMAWSVPLVEADSVVPVFAIEEHGFSPFLVPEDAAAGSYTVVSNLLDQHGGLLASNEHPFEVRARPEGSA